MRRALALGIPLAFLAAACTYDNGDANRVVSDQPSTSCGDPTQSAIDVDAPMIAPDAGNGAGLYIEYASGGHWHLQTTCDTVCEWDVIVTPEQGSAISNTALDASQAGQRLFSLAPTSFEFLARTTSGIDGFTFDADPGASVEVDSYLDNQCAPGFFYWIGDGGLHQGSPANPLTLVPSGK